MHHLLSAEAAARVVAALQGIAWTEGRARTKELTGTVKRNEEILASDPLAKDLLTAIGQRLKAHPGVQIEVLPKAVHMPKFNRHRDGGEYRKHTDAPWMGDVRTDLSCTVFLTDPETYDGGELCIDTPHGLQRIKGQAGECYVYDCGSPHWVEPVTRGERICAVTWIQSRIRDKEKRRMLTSFRKLLGEVEPVNAEWFMGFGQHYSALLRRWSE
jgi:PKHD-type hydroxylase